MAPARPACKLTTPLPADKVTAVEELLRHYGSVAMIGDGVNDAPAMGRATSRLGATR